MWGKYWGFMCFYLAKSVAVVILLWMICPYFRCEHQGFHCHRNWNESDCLAFSHLTAKSPRHSGGLRMKTTGKAIVDLAHMLSMPPCCLLFLCSLCMIVAWYHNVFLPSVQPKIQSSSVQDPCWLMTNSRDHSTQQNWGPLLLDDRLF